MFTVYVLHRHIKFKPFLEYSDPPNTGPSVIRMVIFRTLLKTGHSCPVLNKMAASLDHFIEKSRTKNILFMPKRSRLANRTRMSGFRMVRYSNAPDWHKIQSEYRPRFGIQWVTVFKYLTQNWMVQLTRRFYLKGHENNFHLYITV
jgi:hypothetical protein